MAVLRSYLGLFLFGGCFFGLTLARSVQASNEVNDQDDIVGLTQDLMMSEVLCRVAGCDYDLQLYCLSNGVIVMGTCSLKKTICSGGQRNSLQLADGWDICFQATYTVPHLQQQMVIVHTEQNRHGNDDDLETQALEPEPLSLQSADDEPLTSQTEADDEPLTPQTEADDESLTPQTEADDESLTPQTAADDESLTSQTVADDESLTPQTEADDDVDNSTGRRLRHAQRMEDEQAHKVAETMKMMDKDADWPDLELEQQLVGAQNRNEVNDDTENDDIA